MNSISKPFKHICIFCSKDIRIGSVSLILQFKSIYSYLTSYIYRVVKAKVFCLLCYSTALRTLSLSPIYNCMLSNVLFTQETKLDQSTASEFPYLDNSILRPVCS